MKAKFTIGELLGVGFTIIVLGIGIAYGMDVMDDVADDMATCPTAYPTYNASANMCRNSSGSHLGEPTNIGYNATRDAETGTAKIPEKLPTIVTVIVASTIIGILLTYLWGRVAGKM